MNFSEYFDIITKSVCETGYDAFLPSMCAVDAEDIVMKVLDAKLSPDGDEELAMRWVESFAQEGRTVFLAYRHGQRTVEVVEINGFEAHRKRRINVEPEVEHSSEMRHGTTPVRS